MGPGSVGMGGFFFQGGRVSLAGCQRKEGRVCGPLRVTNVATPVKVEEQSAEVGHLNPFPMPTFQSYKNYQSMCELNTMWEFDA